VTRKRWFQFLIPAAIVALVGVVFAIFASPTTPGSGAGSSMNVTLGKDYYVGVALVELSEKDENGEAWDSYNGTGPDIVVDIYWKGNRIFRSTTKEDSFVAKWSSSELDLKEIALGSQSTSADGLIQAARLNIKEKESIEIQVFDSDIGGDDQAGTKVFRTSELPLGETTHSYKGSGIRRLGLRVVEMPISDGALE